MATTGLVTPMPRKPASLKRAVKIDDDIARRAEIVASHLREPLGDYLSNLLRSLVNRDYSKTVKELAEGERKAPKDSP